MTTPPVGPPPLRARDPQEVGAEESGAEPADADEVVVDWQLPVEACP